MIFHRNRAEYSDGTIDLIPVHIGKPDKELQFGREQVWSIVLHNCTEEIGQISYRNGDSRCVYYFGHIGYHIDPPWRGNHFAARACELIRNEILAGGKTTAVITCDPDNIPSIRTCERLGGLYEGTVDVPEDIRKRFDISNSKRRYIWNVDPYGENYADKY